MLSHHTDLVSTAPDRSDSIYSQFNRFLGSVVGYVKTAASAKAPGPNGAIVDTIRSDGDVSMRDRDQVERDDDDEMLTSNSLHRPEALTCV